MPGDCIFCKIATGSIPVKAIYEDDSILAFPDVNPVAPTHILVIPKRHIENLSAVTDHDGELLKHVMLALPKIAKISGISEGGFRIVVNSGMDGGQSVPHLHWHLLGGRHMDWPPG